jgi:hypothetical protein
MGSFLFPACRQAGDLTSKFSKSIILGRMLNIIVHKKKYYLNDGYLNFFQKYIIQLIPLLAGFFIINQKAYAKSKRRQP